MPFTLPVIIGSHDCDCGMYGVRAGLTDEGVVGDITGTYDHLGFIARGYVNAGEEMLEEQIFLIAGRLRIPVYAWVHFPHQALFWNGL